MSVTPVNRAPTVSVISLPAYRALSHMIMTWLVTAQPASDAVEDYNDDITLD